MIAHMAGSGRWVGFLRTGVVMRSMLLAFWTVFFPFESFAQVQLGPQAKPVTNAQVTTPNECNAAALDRALSPKDIEELVRATPATDKNQFETTADFLKRAEIARLKFVDALVARNKGNTIVALSKLESYNLKYDADRELLTVPLQHGYNTGRAGALYNEVTLFQTSSLREAGTRTFEIRGVVVDKYDSMKPPAWPKNAKAIDLKIKPDAAKMLLDNLHIMIVAAPNPPFVFQYEIRATPDGRLDYSMNTLALVGKPLCAAIVSPESKKILRNLPN